MATRYYHVRGGVEAGPYSAGQLKELAKTGRIHPDDAVRPDGRDKRYPARGVVGLFTPEQLQGASPARTPTAPPAPSPPKQPSPVAPPRSADHPLVELLAALVAGQMESLNERVARGTLSADDRTRRAARMSALFEQVRQAFPAATAFAANSTSPMMPVAPAPPPSDDGGLGMMAGLGAAAIAGGAIGMAASRAAAAPAAYSHNNLAPAPQAMDDASGGGSLSTAARALNALRGWHNTTSPHAAAMPPSAPADYSSGLPHDVQDHAMHGGQDLGGGDIADAEVMDAELPGNHFDGGGDITYDADGGGGDWGGLAADADATDMAGSAADGGDGGGGFFGALFGSDDAGDVAEVADAGDAGDWFGGGDEAGGLLDGAGDVDVGDFDVGDIDIGGFF